MVGCSSSEIENFRIGTCSSRLGGERVYQTLSEICREKGIYLAAQCCEHLNRALILEEEAVRRYGYEPVNVVPQLKAGGSFATAAYHAMEHPVAVEEIRADGGMDIGYPHRHAFKAGGSSGADFCKTDRRGQCGLRQGAAEIYWRGTGRIRSGTGIKKRIQNFSISGKKPGKRRLTKYQLPLPGLFLF